MKVTWLGGASLLFEDARVRILVDPVEFAEGADVVLLTRAHADHLSKETVLSVLAKNPEAVVLASRSAYEAISELSEKYNIFCTYIFLKKIFKHNLTLLCRFYHKIW